MILYFSGTGNSRYCARLLAEKLGDTVMDAVDFIKSGKEASFTSDRPWVFVSPTYGWQLPHIFENFLLKSSFNGNRDAYFIMTCGTDIGNADVWISALCQKLHFHYRGVQAVVMPENYIALFSAPGKNEAKTIIDRAKPVIADAAETIKQGRSFAHTRTGIFDKLKSGLVNTVFCRFIIQSKPFYATDACISCGKCADVCMLHNIELQNGRPVWGKDCTHCMACICSCPKEAIEYGKATKGKVRYQCEEN